MSLIFEIQSDSTPGQTYKVNIAAATCTCKGFTGHGHCKHLLKMGVVAPTPEPPKPKAKPYKPASNSTMLKDFEAYTRTRLSKHYILRDFLYSTEAEILGLSNRPSDDPEMVVASGKALCERVLEPLWAQFGPITITFGYQSRDVLEATSTTKSPTSSSPHQWDRGTFGKEIYARVDILPQAVVDGTITKLAYAHWMMYNLDIDLLMSWHHSQVFCVTIGPKPRRVFLEWVPKGSGTNGGNSVVYMGEQYWAIEWPKQTSEQRPKFGPSASGGKMFWD
jgi:hypothetical protein